MFNRLSMPPEDALHGIMAKYRAETRVDKMDLGVGVYYDQHGVSPVMQAVQQAEELNLSEQTSKSYLGLAGVERFIHGMSSLVLNAELKQRTAAVQTVGGTGGVRLAVEIAAKANPNLRVHIGTPTWPNHFTICEMLNVEAVPFTHFDQATQTLQYDQICAAINNAERGDVFILHGPCHNPTGQDMSQPQFENVLKIAAERGVIPLIDAAYYGLGTDLDDDLSCLSQALKLVPTAFLIMSCSKAFGLYRERTGALFVMTENQAERNTAQATLERIGRGSYSMPPAHGAQAVARILDDAQLTQLWRSELGEMRQRITSVRNNLDSINQGHPVLNAVKSQKGIFSLLPISAEVVARMAEKHAIYMPASGRINVAGFKTNDVERFYQSLIEVAA